MGLARRHTQSLIHSLSSALGSEVNVVNGGGGVVQTSGSRFHSRWGLAGLKGSWAGLLGKNTVCGSPGSRPSDTSPAVGEQLQMGRAGRSPGAWRRGDCGC